MTSSASEKIHVLIGMRDGPLSKSYQDVLRGERMRGREQDCAKWYQHLPKGQPEQTTFVQLPNETQS